MSSSSYCWAPNLLLLLTISSHFAFATPSSYIPPLRTVSESFRHVRVNYDFLPSDVHTFFFNQTLDHFSFRPESYTTFRQKYVINFKYWGGANSSAPIFAYLGEEAPISSDIPIIGFLPDNAPQFKALIVYIEHRFYGESIPYGLSLEEALESPETRGYFSSAQALADYAEILIHIKGKLHAKNSPIIVMGGSYGGMLASWFRLKYPHIAYGALASSAPILLLNNFVPHFGYYSIVSKDFRETSETCYQTIKESWSEIDRVASEPNGLSELSKIFNTCKPLQDVNELKRYLEYEYASSAQYNDPHTKPVAHICDGINNSNGSSSVLSKVFSGLVALKRNQSSMPVPPCFVNPPVNISQTIIGWDWQECSEIVYALARSNDTMFEPYVPSLQSYIDGCNASYGVVPRPHWIPTSFGGQDMESVLRHFTSNIIFSNGLVDPYSNGGVLEDLSRTVRAVYTVHGSHCLDLLPSVKGDPYWLVNQRKTEVGIIRRWINKYYAELKTLRDA
ncbi:hypothetical protein CDL15_Pgr025133 [Punica granatum]|nr:hypothetical protein CDL15_Pgr025133 [Punica granatum]PKI78792.1 hypothetical protein CRG98_000859 [Punica granatum]